MFSSFGQGKYASEETEQKCSPVLMNQSADAQLFQKWQCLEQSSGLDSLALNWLPVRRPVRGIRISLLLKVLLFFCDWSSLTARTGVTAAQAADSPALLVTLSQPDSLSSATSPQSVRFTLPSRPSFDYNGFEMPIHPLEPSFHRWDVAEKVTKVTRGSVQYLTNDLLLQIKSFICCIDEKPRRTEMEMWSIKFSEEQGWVRMVNDSLQGANLTVETSHNLFITQGSFHSGYMGELILVNNGK